MRALRLALARRQPAKRHEHLPVLLAGQAADSADSTGGCAAVRPRRLARPRSTDRLRFSTDERT